MVRIINSNWSTGRIFLTNKPLFLFQCKVDLQFEETVQARGTPRQRPGAAL